MVYTWDNVSIGGGGYITGIYPSPIEQNLIYVRTDIGGFYRWNPLDNSWIPLTEFLTSDKANLYGGEALALDPNNVDIVYIAVGKNTPSWAGLGTIYKSIDRGNTWTKLNINLPMGGNETKRWTGGRLKVNPFDSNVLLFGSRTDGIYKSIDAGLTWNKITFPGVLKPGVGVTEIKFSKTVNGLVYANCYGDSIYQSTDTGLTWTKVLNCPVNINRIAFKSGGLYATHSLGVSKYVNGVWVNITPGNTLTNAFNGLGVNPLNSNHVIVSYDQYHSINNYNRLFESFDSGSTWTSKSHILSNQVPWWENWLFGSAMSAIEFDPFVINKVWLSDWFGTWQTTNINSSTPTWTNYETGHEETVVFDILSTPKKIVSCLADVEGFNHTDYTVYPTNKMSGNFQDVYDISYCESQPTKMIRVGGHRGLNFFKSSKSVDSGNTWIDSTNFPANTIPLRVSICPNDPNNYVIINSEKQPIRTVDDGVNWLTVNGLPNGFPGMWNWIQPFTSDKSTTGTFYYYKAGKLYKSTDKGANFAIINSTLPINDWCVLSTITGEIWLGLHTNGLYKSIDNGVTFTKITNVQKAYLYSFGKPATGSTTPTLFLYGKVNNLDGIWRSLDKGLTWLQIGDPNIPIGDYPNSMEASKQTFGTVFIGTNGRGLYYGKE